MPATDTVDPEDLIARIYSRSGPAAHPHDLIALVRLVAPLLAAPPPATLDTLATEAQIGVDVMQAEIRRLRGELSAVTVAHRQERDHNGRLQAERDSLVLRAKEMDDCYSALSGLYDRLQKVTEELRADRDQLRIALVGIGEAFDHLGPVGDDVTSGDWCRYAAKLAEQAKSARARITELETAHADNLAARDRLVADNAELRREVEQLKAVRDETLLALGSSREADRSASKVRDAERAMLIQIGDALDVPCRSVNGGVAESWAAYGADVLERAKEIEARPVLTVERMAETLGDAQVLMALHRVVEQPGEPHLGAAKTVLDRLGSVIVPAPSASAEPVAFDAATEPVAWAVARADWRDHLDADDLFVVHGFDQKEEAEDDASESDRVVVPLYVHPPAQAVQVSDEDRLDAARYRRLRVLGAAPSTSPHLEAGTVLCFTNLDTFIDDDIAAQPSRGEADEPFSPTAADFARVKEMLGEPPGPCLWCGAPDAKGHRSALCPVGGRWCGTCPDRDPRTAAMGAKVMTVADALKPSHVVEWFARDTWQQYLLGSKAIPWRFWCEPSASSPGGWSPWQPQRLSGVDYTATSRRVPLADADTDPSTRGPLEAK